MAPAPSRPAAPQDVRDSVMRSATTRKGDHHIQAAFGGRLPHATLTLPMLLGRDPNLHEVFLPGRRCVATQAPSLRRERLQLGHEAVDLLSCVVVGNPNADGLAVVRQTGVEPER